MKKLFTLVVLMSLLFVGCKKDDNILDANHPIAIQGQVATRSIDSVLHVVTKAQYLSWISGGEILLTSLGIQETYLYENGITRDEENRRLLFQGQNVINPDQDRLGMFITDAKDIIFSSMLDSLGNTVDPKTTDYRGDFARDTIGYIPNKVLKEAQDAITAAYNAEDYKTCYSLFDNAMIFLPTTGEKYRKLKELGIE